ncbi:MAG: hypothetical protein PVF65_06180 [Sphingomonadales bacterium]|jgi:hypothetical protein
MSKNMKPFLLQHHEVERIRYRALKPEEFKRVSGGNVPGDCESLTVTDEDDGGFDPGDC